MPRHPLTLLALVGTLALAACRDASAPEQATSAGQVVPNPPVPPSTITDSDRLALDPDRDILVDDSLTIHAYLHRQPGAGPDTLDWTVSDSTLARIEVVGKDQVVIHALQAGYVLVSAHTRLVPRLEASTSVKTYRLSSQPPSIEVSEFRVVESWNQNAGRYLYAPQLALRATAPIPVRIFSVTVAIPDLGLSVFCGANQSLAETASPLFAPLDDGHEMEVLYGSVRPVAQAAQAVATITVLSANGMAARLVANGEIDSGAVIPGYYDAPPGNWLWCQ